MLIRKTSTKLEQMVMIMQKHFEFQLNEETLEVLYKYKFAPMMYRRKEQSYMEKSNPRLKKPIRPSMRGGGYSNTIGRNNNNFKNSPASKNSIMVTKERSTFLAVKNDSINSSFESSNSTSRSLAEIEIMKSESKNTSFTINPLKKQTTIKIQKFEESQIKLGEDMLELLLFLQD